MRQPSKLAVALGRRGDSHTRAPAQGVALALMLSLIAPAWGQDAPTQKPNHQPTLDELLHLQPAPKPSQKSTPSETSTKVAPPGRAGLTPELQRDLAGEAPADTFEQAVDEMRDVAQRLDRTHEPGIEIQRQQKAILAKLDQVIAAARRRESSSSSSSSNSAQRQETGSARLASQGQQPGSQGQASSQPGAAPNATGAGATSAVNQGKNLQQPMNELRRQWGDLPPRLRDDLSQGLKETFSPIYRELTQAYYRRLAQQK